LSPTDTTEKELESIYHKFKKWNDTYEKNRHRFDSFDNFVNW